MSKKLFEGINHASLYAKYRFQISDNIVNPIIDFLSQTIKKPFERVVDVGCGSGQAAPTLSKHFMKYIGVDVSVNQIKEANSSPLKPKNAEYFASSCEDMKFLEPNCVDLISASQSYHWFDHSKFKVEANRLLKSGGVVAIYSYHKIDIDFDAYITGSPESDNIKGVWRSFFNAIDVKWDSSRRLVENKYEDVIMPFEDVTRTENCDFIEEPFSFLYGYLQTLSPFQTILKEDPNYAYQLLENFKSDMILACGKNWIGDETSFRIIRKYVLIFCRKPFV